MAKKFNPNPNRFPSVGTYRMINRTTDRLPKDSESLPISYTTSFPSRVTVSCLQALYLFFSYSVCSTFVILNEC